MDSHLDLVTHYGAVRNFAARFERPYLCADDITQEAYAQALHTLRNKDPPERPRSYLFTIVRRVARKERLRYEWFLGQASGWQGEGGAPGPLEALYAGEVREGLEAGLQQLGKSDEAVLRDHYLEGRSCAEIGEMLGLSKSATKQRLRRARKRLGTILGQVDD